LRGETAKQLPNVACRMLVWTSREAFHETGDAQRAPAWAPFCFTRARARLLTSASWARNVPRQHRLNSLGVTTASLLLELVTQRAGRWIWGSPVSKNRRQHWLRSTEASDKHALETLRGGRTRSSQVWLGPRQKLHGENVCRMTTSISRIKTLRVYQRQPPWSCRA
jgi:hypothetical protein